MIFEPCDEKTCRKNVLPGQTQNRLYNHILRLEVLKLLYLGSIGIVLCSENKGADQLWRYCATNLRLYFRKGKTQVFC